MIDNSDQKSKKKISSVEITRDVLTSRGGLTLFIKYLESITILNVLFNFFRKMKGSKKGFDIVEIFKQLFCYFVDGSKLHLSRFDELKKDPAYAASIETTQEDMCSTDQVKRFLKKFTPVLIWIFRKVLQMLFIWRLKIAEMKSENKEKALPLIKIYVDTMVMNNNDAEKREGCNPSYKKVKGFQPLHFIWNEKIIDLVFRGGSKHSNNGDTVLKAIRSLVNKIRKQYRQDANIAFMFDSGFFDDKIFNLLEEMEVYYTASGKFYDNIKKELSLSREESLRTYKKNKQIWKYCEFTYKCGTWSKGRKAIYTIPVCDENGQLIMEFGAKEGIIITNIPNTMLTPEKIIETHHSTGKYELTHKRIKEFSGEKLPFKRFSPNSAYYNVMVIAFFLFQCFIEDTAVDVIPDLKSNCYISTARRILIDFAGKIVSHAGTVVLKVTESLYNSLKMKELWIKCNQASVIQLL